jgi:hypothetical protein
MGVVEARVEGRLTPRVRRVVRRRVLSCIFEFGARSGRGWWCCGGWWLVVVGGGDGAGEAEDGVAGALGDEMRAAGVQGSGL